MIFDVVQEMKRKLTIVGIVIVLMVVAAGIGFLFGAARVLRTEVKGSVAMNATVLGLIETGRTDRAVQLLEGLLIGQLNALDSMERSGVCYSEWYVLNVNDTHSAKWESLRQYATDRVKIKRDEWNYMTSHPAETVKRFEKTFEDSFRASGNTNVKVRVTDADDTSVKIEIDGMEK